MPQRKATFPTMHLVDHTVFGHERKAGVFLPFQIKVFHPEPQNSVYLNIYKYNIIHTKSAQVPPTFLPR